MKPIHKLGKITRLAPRADSKKRQMKSNFSGTDTALKLRVESVGVGAQF